VDKKTKTPRGKKRAGQEVGDKDAAMMENEAQKSLEQTNPESEKIKAQTSALASIARQFGLEEGDVQGILSAVKGQSDELKRMQTEKEAYAKKSAQALKEDTLNRAAENMYDWARQSMELGEKYKIADISKELGDKTLAAMLKAGVPLRTAYEVIHFDTIKQDISRSAAEKAVTRTVENIRARGMRAQENGISSQNGVSLKTDVSKLTRTERQLLAARALKGEEIIL
jgi:hypothetical protein